MNSRLFEKYNFKLKQILDRAIKKDNNELALQGIESLAKLYYEWNQFYGDDSLEIKLSMLSEKMVPKIGCWTESDSKKKTALFYDGFGLDTRGLALIYLKALAHLDYDVVYITVSSATDRQPIIDRALTGYKVVRKYYSISDTYQKQIADIAAVFKEYTPQVAFLYTTPWDVSGISVFNCLKGIQRFQINLTDHTFWLGKTAFDCCIEFRDYGGFISKNFRGISDDKLVMLPYYPYIDDQIGFNGLPFEIGNYKVIFSGGSLYKTFDENSTFYNIIDKVLVNHRDVLFLYVGGGDTSKLKELKQKFGNRVQYIQERDDFYEIMKRSYLYLNTYPVSGALMVQYAAMAGLLPVTLLFDDESHLLLNNRLELQIEFSSVEELWTEIDKLLDNEEYRYRKCKFLKDSVIREKQFQNELDLLIKEGNTSFKFNLEESFETESFREIYKAQFSKKQCIDLVCKKKLVRYFPFECLKKVYGKFVGWRN